LSGQRTALREAAFGYSPGSGTEKNGFLFACHFFAAGVLPHIPEISKR